jgi:hypothetical protein
MIVDPVGSFAYGYRMSEYLVRPMDQIPPVVPSLKIVKVFKTRTDTQDRLPISVSLPLCQRALAYQPDPDDVPGHVNAVAKRLAFDPRSLNQDGCTLASGVVCPPKTIKNALTMRGLKLRKIRRFVFGFCKKHFVPIAVDEDVTVETWLLNAPYSASRKKNLMEAFNRWGGDPTRKLPKRVTLVKGFTKNEWYETKKLPRNINARSDLFKVILGPLAAVISKKVFANKFFIKNVPVKDRPIVIRDALFGDHRKYYLTDFTSFESHFDKDVQLSIEAVLYSYMCMHRPDLQALLNTILPTLTGMNVILYKLFEIMLEAKRCSGEMVTSLGNGFSNLMLFLFLCKLKHLPQPMGFVEGDDGIFCFKRNQVNAPTTEDFTALGWNIKMVTTDRLETASFCGNVFDVDEVIVVTDPRWPIVTFGWAPKRYVHASYNTRLQLLRARGFSLVYQYGSCPMLGKLGYRILALTNHITLQTKRLRNYVDSYKCDEFMIALKKPLPPYVEPGVKTRWLVEDLYGVTVEQQLCFEAYVDQFELNMTFNVNYDYDIGWDDQYERYVLPRGVSFAPPGANDREQKRVILEAIPRFLAQFYKRYEK